MSYTACGAVTGGAAAGGAASEAGNLEDYYNCGAAVRRRSRGTGTGPNLVETEALAIVPGNTFVLPTGRI